MRKYFTYLCIIFLSWFLLHTAIITIDGLTDELKPADVGVVLGNKVEFNGEPSLRLKSRLDRGVELYRAGYFKHIIVSGGLGKEGFYEADVMKRYLIKQGIAEKFIISDRSAKNTYDTAKNSRKIMTEMNYQSALVISQYYHISRTKLAFSKAGVETIAAAHAKRFEIRDAYALIREFFGFYKYLFLSY